MPKRVKCWRCATPGTEGSRCQGCGRTVSEYDPEVIAKFKTKNKTKVLAQDREISSKDQIATVRQPSATSASDGPSEEIMLLRKIQQNTHETSAYLSALLISIYYAIIGGVLVWFNFERATAPVNYCTEYDQTLCKPDYGSLTMGFVILFATAVLILIQLRTPFRLAREAQKNLSS